MPKSDREYVFCVCVCVCVFQVGPKQISLHFTIGKMEHFWPTDHFLCLGAQLLHISLLWPLVASVHRCQLKSQRQIFE